VRRVRVRRVSPYLFDGIGGYIGLALPGFLPPLPRLVVAPRDGHLLRDRIFPADFGPKYTVDLIAPASESARDRLIRKNQIPAAVVPVFSREAVKLTVDP
jgi:hypothetical protein